METPITSAIPVKVLIKYFYLFANFKFDFVHIHLYHICILHYLILLLPLDEFVEVILTTQNMMVTTSPKLEVNFESDDLRSWPGLNALRNPNKLENDCNWPYGGSVGIKKGTNLFWQVDLEEPYDITHIRLRAFNLDGFSDDVQFRVCKDEEATDCTDCGGLVTPPVNDWISVECSTKGRYVRLLNADSKDENWHFCRVAIYGFKRLSKSKS